MNGADTQLGSKSLPATLATRPRNGEPGCSAVALAKNVITGDCNGGQMKGFILRTSGRSSGGGQESIRTSHGKAQSAKMPALLWAPDARVLPSLSDSAAAAIACTAKTQ